MIIASSYSPYDSGSRWKPQDLPILKAIRQANPREPTFTEPPFRTRAFRLVATSQAKTSKIKRLKPHAIEALIIDNYQYYLGGSLL